MSYFLIHEDFLQLIKADQLEVVISREPAILKRAILAAIAEMESYLRARYDVTTIFATQGEERNTLLLTYGVDIALYHLHARINPKNISQIRYDRYKEAKLWLEMVSEGRLSPNLPAAETGGEVSVGMNWGSSPKHRGERAYKGRNSR